MQSHKFGGSRKKNILMNIKLLKLTESPLTVFNFSLIHLSNAFSIPRYKRLSLLIIEGLKVAKKQFAHLFHYLLHCLCLLFILRLKMYLSGKKITFASVYCY